MYRCDACAVNVTHKPAIKVEVEYPNRMFPRGHNVCPACKNKMDTVPEGDEAHAGGGSAIFHSIRAHTDKLIEARDEAYRIQQAEKAEAARTFSNHEATLRKMGTKDAFRPLVQPTPEHVNKNHRGGLGASPKESPAPKTGKAKRKPAIQLMPKPKAPRLVS